MKKKKGKEDDSHDDARSTKHLGTWADESRKNRFRQPKNKATTI
jgi:hypothetical protein